jgi:hypothetical protein
MGVVPFLVGDSVFGSAVCVVPVWPVAVVRVVGWGGVDLADSGWVSDSMR